ncbi:HD domain-containing protein [Paenisporosarcina cavernae]|uniref:HD domain-containing protein n=2 Tax=Paenisporosarcina cavernae TaxID=2320858 RepID=A0A385YYW2_9BACL|nr:HD domain-containing protein [Paenisporosarcina cavernae]
MEKVYQTFLQRLIRDYLIGSGIAVLGVGSIFIYAALDAPPIEGVRLLLILVVSLLVMVAAEIIAIRKHLAPIKQLVSTPDASISSLKSVYHHVHRLPLLALKRIFGPHLMGISIPAGLLLVVSIWQEWINLPYTYIILAAIGGPLVACMHAFVEFFLNSETMKPLAVAIQRKAFEQHGIDLSLDGEVVVSIRRKFLWSMFLIGTFPLFLFILGGYIRVDILSNSVDYWVWAGIIILVGISFSALGAWVLTREITHPIQQTITAMAAVQDGNFEQKVSDIYSDEFSQVVTGFNSMVDGLKMREQKNDQLIQSYFATLAAALDARDPYTAGHSERVAAYSVEIGKLAGLPIDEIETLQKSALLHDIGKIGIRDEILLKEGKLTEEEYSKIKEHPLTGEAILKEIKPAESMAPLLPGVRSHHESYNGKGYPDGLVGEAIPLQGRIMAIADAFDAMTSDRPYRKGMETAKALQILREGSGIQWDPILTPLFIQNYSVIEKRIQKNRGK